MLAAEDMLEALLGGRAPQDEKYDNDDHDFSKVLEFCGNETVSTHILRYPDGREEAFHLIDREN